MKTVYEIRHYLSSNGKDIYMQWWDKLRDHKARLALDRRVNRVALGNFGDHKYLRDGVSELGIDVGPGYRIDYAIEGTQLVLLLFGGDKSTQSADIDRACSYWRDWQQRNEEREGSNEHSQ